MLFGFIPLPPLRDRSLRESVGSMTTCKEMKKARARRYAQKAARRIPAAIMREDRAIRAELAAQEAQQRRRELIQEMRELAKVVAAATNNDRFFYLFSTYKPYANGKKGWSVTHEVMRFGGCHYNDPRDYYISKSGRVYGRTWVSEGPWFGRCNYERIGFNSDITNRHLLSVVWRLRKAVKAIRA